MALYVTEPQKRSESVQFWCLVLHVLLNLEKVQDGLEVKLNPVKILRFLVKAQYSAMRKEDTAILCPEACVVLLLFCCCCCFFVVF